MTQSLVLLFILCFCLGLAGWLVFLWAAGRGQFDDHEGPKYRILEEDDETPPEEER